MVNKDVKLKYNTKEALDKCFIDIYNNFYIKSINKKGDNIFKTHKFLNDYFKINNYENLMQLNTNTSFISNDSSYTSNSVMYKIFDNTSYSIMLRNDDVMVANCIDGSIAMYSEESRVCGIDLYTNKYGEIKLLERDYEYCIDIIPEEFYRDLRPCGDNRVLVGEHFKLDYIINNIFGCDWNVDTISPSGDLINNGIIPMNIKFSSDINNTNGLDELCIESTITFDTQWVMVNSNCLVGVGINLSRGLVIFYKTKNIIDPLK